MCKALNDWFIIGFKWVLHRKDIEYMTLILHYIREMLLYVAIGFLIGLIRLAILHRHNKIKDKKHEILMLLFIAYLAGLISQTIIPRFSFGVFSNTGEFYFHIYFGSDRHINLIPFQTITQYLTGNIDVNADDVAPVAALNLVANLLLFCPLGFFLPALWDKFVAFKRLILTGICIDVMIEMIQFLIGRSADIDDVILNVLGIAAGYCVYKLIPGKGIFSSSKINS